MIKVLVVDDQAIVRDGLVTVLGLTEDIDVVGQAENGVRALELVDEENPDVVLMDLRMPEMDGAGATARLRDSHPEVAVLVLTTFADDSSIAGALASGARGYLTKDASRQEVAAAIRTAASGQVTFAREIGEKIAGSFSPRTSPRDRFPSLTSREAEVLDRMVDGKSNAEIAQELFLTVGTVKSYTNAVFSKLGARNRAHAIALATGRADEQRR
ncbi:response regulator transcription factor [Rothia uropygialis]|uniref:response regulator transcription factor n=1 Tax=Kocuria sp. 36 TaxID=1415402 RepID=UPI00101DC5D7|nr:response regulator transcription factor [Kocuria sp. 36]